MYRVQSGQGKTLRTESILQSTQTSCKPGCMVSNVRQNGQMATVFLHWEAQDVIDFYRTRFQPEFCFRDAKQHAGIMNCQSTDFRILAFHFNASLAATNLAKTSCKRMVMKYFISSCKSVIHNAYILERFICVSGIEPNTHLIDKLFKELILFTAKAA